MKYTKGLLLMDKKNRERLIRQIGELEKSDKEENMGSNILGSELIIKSFDEKTKYDNDLEALSDLNAISHFPSLYAYDDKKIDNRKTKGYNLEYLIKTNKIEKEELEMIKIMYEDAVYKCLEIGRCNYSLKLKGIYWDRESLKIKIMDFGLHEKYGLVGESIDQLVENFYLEVKLIMLYAHVVIPK